MPMRLRNSYLSAAASTLLVVVAVQQPASAQEILPNPALLLVRSATTANGGIESEWAYHKPANAAKFRKTYIPISKFAGGPGYCTPPSIAHYYGCDTSHGCRRSANCSNGSCDCR